MPYELLKTATVTTIRQVLKNAPSTPLAQFNHLPQNYVVDQKQGSAVAEYAFGDFKQAMCYFNLIANTCSQFNYYPELRNVYNRITVKLYTYSQQQKSLLTEKELYVSHLINQLVSHKAKDAHEKALSRVQQLV